MAGGIGSRFWPLSRNNKPKQFLDILGTGSSLIRQTYSRVTRFCKPENVLIVTSDLYNEQVLEHIPEIGEDQVLLEPMRRNTAPCIAYATHKIALKDPSACIVVAPSDHMVLNEEAFLKTIAIAINFASTNNALLTIGIKPNRPETGYGYIQIGKQADKRITNLYKVKTFTEKPNMELARVFLQSGEFYWNSGMFIWSLPAIQEAFSKHLPEIHSLFAEAQPLFNTQQENQAVANVYSQCKNVSIDYGIMEKADNVHVICSEFGWSDLGTWGSLFLNSKRDANENAIIGKNVVAHNAKNCIVHMPADKLVLLEGLDGYIVVESDGILLVCRKENEQEIKNYLSEIIIEKGEQFA